MIDRFQTIVWNAAVRFAGLMRRVGLWGPVCRPLISLGQRLIPPPTNPGQARLDGGVELTVPAGWPSSRTMQSGLYEPELTALFVDLVCPGWMVIDVGANIGYYTLQSSRLVGPGGRVIAFEPDPIAAKALRNNLEFNACANVDVLELALSSRPGRADLCVPQPEHGYLQTGAATGSGVETTTMDRVLSSRDWPVVDLVKMDIEGGEVAALRGMTETCRRNPEMALILELNVAALSRSDTTPHVLIDLLISLGFTRAYFIELEHTMSLGVDPLPGPVTHSEAMYNVLCDHDIRNI